MNILHLFSVLFTIILSKWNRKQMQAKWKSLRKKTKKFIFLVNFIQYLANWNALIRNFFLCTQAHSNPHSQQSSPHIHTTGGITNNDIFILFPIIFSCSLMCETLTHKYSKLYGLINSCISILFRVEIFWSSKQLNIVSKVTQVDFISNQF